MVEALLGLFLIAWDVYGVWAIVSDSRTLRRRERFYGPSGDSVHEAEASATAVSVIAASDSFQ